MGLWITLGLAPPLSNGSAGGVCIRVTIGFLEFMFWPHTFIGSLRVIGLLVFMVYQSWPLIGSTNKG